MSKRDKTNIIKLGWSGAGFAIGFAIGYLIIESIVSAIILGIGLALAIGIAADYEWGKSRKK